MAEALSKLDVEISGAERLEVPEALWVKVRKDWLIADMSCEDWFEQVGDRHHQLQAYSKASSTLSTPLVLIAESDPAIFLASFWAALLAKWNIALANHQWGSQEWQSVGELICPDIVWGEAAEQADFFNAQSTAQSTAQSIALLTGLSVPAMLIPTGGSSGKIKFAHHTWASLMASVRGFRQYFTPDGEPINTCCVLPVYHVSGLMQALRSWVSGGQVAIVPFKQIETALAPSPMRGGYISLVPTQLERLIRAKKGPWLSDCQTVFLGGAPPWPSLLDCAMELRIPLCLSYGSTETAAMVTALRPTDFLQGVRSSGRSLPHATIQILREGRSLQDSEIGQVVIRSSAIAQTNPETTTQQNLLYTDDLGYLDADGHLHITGRASHKIISGGENIFPAEVEAALRSSGQVRDVCVLGWPDSQWGQIVVAAYVPAGPEVSMQGLREAIATTISRYKQPKRWIELAALPRNAQGKLNRQQLIEQLSQSMPTAHQSAQNGGESEG